MAVVDDKVVNDTDVLTTYVKDAIRGNINVDCCLHNGVNFTCMKLLPAGMINKNSASHH